MADGKFYLRITLLQRTKSSGPNPEFGSKVVELPYTTMQDAKLALEAAAEALRQASQG